MSRQRCLTVLSDRVIKQQIKFSGDKCKVMYTGKKITLIIHTEALVRDIAFAVGDLEVEVESSLKMLMWS